MFGVKIKTKHCAYIIYKNIVHDKFSVSPNSSVITVIGDFDYEQVYIGYIYII